MQILSLEFACFLCTVFFAYWLISNEKRKYVLLLVNLVFYSFFGIKQLFILFLTVAISFLGSILISKYKERKKIVFTITIILLTCILLSKYQIFKALFYIDSINKHYVDIVSVVGLSFYSLEAISYVVDTYKEKVNVCNFIDYCNYISFFPCITSGPINRYNEFAYELNKNKVFDYNKETYALKLIAIGLFKKTVIADCLAGYTDTFFSNVYIFKGPILLVIMFMYSIQIYMDFSGYSDIAVGIAKLFDIEIVNNFNAPYFSKNIKEFWSKWHISLTSWLRDYIYIPLGGNRCSRLRHYFNILVTYIVSGFWHGANLTYLVWGILHALAQILCDINRRKETMSNGRFNNISKTLSLLLFLTIAWVFFRSDSITDALYIINPINICSSFSMQYALAELNISKLNVLKLLLCILVIYYIDFMKTKNIDTIESISKKQVCKRWIVYIVLCLMIVYLSEKGSSEFIYYKF